MGNENASNDGNIPIQKRLREFSWMLAFLMFYMASCAFNFGYDVGNFGGVQGMQSFAKKFGQYNSSKGLYALPAWLSSLMTSLPFLGKALGAITCGWISERWGRKKAILGLVGLSFLGVLLQTCATTAAQFTVGRFISFGMTGMTIVVVPLYQGEVAPGPLRGMMAATLQLMIIVGQVVASLVNLGTQHIASDAGWRLSVGLQFVAPAIILGLLPIVPESPRWLLAKGRPADAHTSLRRIRKKEVSDAEIEFEVQALRHANSLHGKGTWAEVFDKNNRLRTLVAVIAMFGEQITGQAFQSQYSVIFYQQHGFKDQAFLFGVIGNVVQLVCLIGTWFFVDGIGRRPLVMTGGFFMGIFLFVIAGVSSVATPNFSEAHAMVASLMLFGASFALSWAPVSYIVLSEVAASRVKEKTNLLASVVSILVTFVTSFTIPYLMNEPYAALGGKIGYIYGAINMVMVVVAYFMIPELKGRSLEEVDQLFQSGAPLRKFGAVKTEAAEQLYADQARINVEEMAKSEHTE
ncbi:hypothetical protein SBRCBS47491_009855 [Sporothrix bragantina]|uniref:Major facilitator superfamily (MFS) profile domain-containing protein n=1 Tax=Sporothrix bragantina TaxID=671064 RepID=A0ABP0D1E1_9PEZI